MRLEGKERFDAYLTAVFCFHMRVEDPEVFERTHGKILELVADGVVDGLRIDHPDGLRDPSRYLEHLRERRQFTGVVELTFLSVHRNEE